MLEHITPVILTFNEAPNIARTLDALTWAKRVVVMDSFSTDNTQEICADFANVDFYQHPFGILADQWKVAISQNISTTWVLALDADYVVSTALVDEIAQLNPRDEIGGYLTSFVYKIDGKSLRGTLYPPVITLYRLAGADYQQDGHAQRVQVTGDIEPLRHKMFHDDRKSPERWHQSQRSYARQEAEKFSSLSFKQLNINDKIRYVGLGPFIVIPYTLLAKGALFDGWAGLKYTYQRSYRNCGEPLITLLKVLAIDTPRSLEI